MASTIHHLHSAPGDASTTVSRLLLGLLQPLPVADVSALLGDIAKRVYEVISVQVQGWASLDPPSGEAAGWGLNNQNARWTLKPD